LSALALINCSQLVTLAGPPRPRVGAEMRELSVIADGALLVRDGRLVAVGERKEIEPLISADCDVVDVGGRVVLPGFVDAHTHPVFAGTRADEFEKRAAGATYQEIAAEGGGIRSTVRRTRARRPGERDELRTIDESQRAQENSPHRIFSVDMPRARQNWSYPPSDSRATKPDANESRHCPVASSVASAMSFVGSTSTKSAARTCRCAPHK
jgi:hypothetical protein